MNKKIFMESKNWTHWFEIAVNDFDRARKFYETIFEIKIEVNDFGNFKMGIFPHKETGGAICFGQWYKAGENGTLIYLDASPDLALVQARIEKAGGKILQSKKQISPQHGYMCLFNDSEGNRLALHSMQ